MPATAEPLPNNAPTAAADAGNMDDKSLLVAIKMERLGNSKKVPGGAYTIRADKSMIRASKKLLDSAELKAVGSLDGEVRKYMESRAVPSFFRAGVWRVPIACVEEVYARLTAFAANRAALVDALVVAYPTLVDQAMAKLDSVANARDYKDQDEVRAEFAFSWQFITFGVPETLRAINKSLFESEKAKTQAMFVNANRQIQDLLRTQCAEMVNHMVDRLTPGEDGKAKTFHATSVEKIQDFLATFDARNLTNDTELAVLVEKARQLVDGVDPEKLREGADLRATVGAGFADIKAALSKMITLKPKRKITFEDEPPAATQPELPTAATA